MPNPPLTPDPVVCVVGLGYVGLPLARLFFDAGLTVIGLDTDHRKIDALHAGKGYISYLGDTFVAPLTASDRFTATTNPDAMSQADAIIICVPSPLGEHNEPDLSYVKATCDEIGPRLRPGHIVVLESTTYPGTTRDVARPILESASGLVADGSATGFHLAFSPEREDPANPAFSTRNTPKLIGGLVPESTRVGAALYRHAIEMVVEVSSAEVAESAKLLENIYRAVNIAMVNEMKVVLTELGVDVWEVIEAAKTKPFGFQAFYPGPGIGGHCIPIDPFYMTWRAKEAGLPTRFIELAGEINNAMPRWTIEQLALALNEVAKPIRGSSILIVGLAYKPGVSDVRESPALELITRLRDLGASVAYHDPMVPATHKMRKFDLGMTSVDLTAQSLASYDAVLIATAQSGIDWAFIGEHAKLVIDTRNAMVDVRHPNAAIKRV